MENFQFFAETLTNLKGLLAVGKSSLGEPLALKKSPKAHRDHSYLHGEALYSKSWQFCEEFEVTVLC